LRADHHHPDTCYHHHRLPNFETYRHNHFPALPRLCSSQI
jgi:hypothetical protein